MITFNRADTEHCKVVVVSGRPLLESTYDGTSVAIGMPVNRGNGEFSVFVAVSQSGPGSIQVNPKDFYALYPDPSRTRFTFYDKAAEMGYAQALGLGTPAGSTSPPLGGGGLSPGSGGPAPGLLGDDGPNSGSSPASKGSPPGSTMASIYFHRGKIKQGDRIAGWITLRQATRTKLVIRPTDMLDEIDIPVNGIVFRF